MHIDYKTWIFETEGLTVPDFIPDEPCESDLCSKEAYLKKAAEIDRATAIALNSLLWLQTMRSDLKSLGYKKYLDNVKED